MKEDSCDVVLGVPAGFERTLTSAPYYRSSYVFAAREGRGPAIRSLDDPALRTLRIGVQLVGDDGMNTRRRTPWRRGGSSITSSAS